VQNSQVAEEHAGIGLRVWRL